MPRFNGTGPEGKGELTGRGLGASRDGVCEGKNAGVSVNQGFYGRGRQMNDTEVRTQQRGRGLGPCGLGLRKGNGGRLCDGSGRGLGLGLRRGRQAGMGRGIMSTNGRGMGRNFN